jgi:predicted kinase
MTDNETQLIHLICGSTGAGKTTYARELAKNIDGVVFSIDEWMVSLFGEDAPANLDPTWIFPRVRRCEAQMWEMASQLGKLGVPSILDWGFQRYEHRQRYAGLARQGELAAKLHVLDVDASERWKRVSARNKNQGETFHMEIARGMFDYIETTWERPSRDEIEAVSRIDFGQ